MEKKEYCIGIDVSKNTLDIAIFDGGMDWNKHIQVSNNSKGYASILVWLGRTAYPRKTFAFVWNTRDYTPILSVYGWKINR